MKKLLVLLLVAVMIFSLVACDTEKTVDTNPTETQNNNKPVETEAAEFQGPPVTVTWMSITNEPEDAEAVVAYMNELLLERYNLQIKFEWIGTGEYNDRTKLASTAGEDYDIVYTTYSWLNKFDENLARGSFYDITDILDEYGATIKEDLVPEMWDVATVSGRIYAIPNQQASATGLAFYVQKDLADKYGLDPTKPVTSGKDIEWFLEEIAQNEKDIFPIHIPQGPFPQDWENMAASSIVGIEMTDDPSDGIVVSWKTYDSSSDYLREWYAKGYLHPDYNVSKELDALRAQNKFAVYTANDFIDGESQAFNENGEEYYQIPYSNAYLSRVSGSDTMLAINANSKDPIAALRLINAFWEDEEIYNTLMFGLEGVHYNKTAENRVELIEGSTWDLYSYDWSFGNQFNRWLLPNEYDNKWAETYEANATADVSPVRGFVPDLTDLQVEITQVNAVRGEYRYYFLEDNWEELLEEYNQKLIDAGVETIVKSIQEQLDAWLANR